MTVHALEPVEAYLPYAEGAAKKFCSILRQNCKLSYDDVLQEARIALLNAYSKYSAEKNNSFKTYAYIKMRGAILDYSRKALNQPLYIAKQRVIEINNYVAKLDSEGITKTDEELAKDLHRDVQSIKESRQLRLTNKLLDFTSCESSNETGGKSDAPIYETSSTEESDAQFIRLSVESAINKLPVKQKDILVDVYFNNLSDTQLAQKHSVCKASAANYRIKAINMFKQVYLS